jgi:hypothetical protein
MGTRARISLGLLAGWAALCAAPGQAQDHPRLGLYGGVYNANYPLTTGGESGPLNDAALDAEARYHDLVLQPSNITPYRPDIPAALRQRRPNIQLYAYVLGEYIWQVAHADSLVHYPTRYRRLVRDLGGFLYNQLGGEFSGANVNLAKRNAQGRFVVAEGIADLFYSALVTSGQWDGLFIDQLCNSILWMETPTERIDFIRAGYPTLTAFDGAWKAATDTLGDRLRRLVGNDYVLIGNCAQGTKYASFNGWMREDFPNQNGGTWYENMFRDPGGYFIDEQRFRAPRHNYIFTYAANANTPYSSINLRKTRLGLGTAALGDGFGVVGPNDLNGMLYPYYNWWYDEYAVDLTTGRSSADIAHTGWLGRPLAAAYQMIWPGSGNDAVTNPGFESDVTTGWTFQAFDAVGNVSQDIGTAGVGAASARIHIAAAGAFDHSAVFTTTGRLSLTANTNYSATFWAKASTPRTIGVAAGVPGGSPLAGRAVDIGTTWRQYQVVLTPTAGGLAGLQFMVGKNAGDVWLDDCHLQAGVFGVYRRDFQNGIVLVNPSATVQTVPLERAFRKIQGNVDPLVNNGQSVTQVAVPPSDALFLIGDDRIPPAAVNDLQPATP